MSSTPHGGALIDARIPAEQANELRTYALGLPALQLSEVEAADLEMIADGALSPLDGFLREDDYKSVVTTIRLANGTVWSIPITLSVDEAKRPKAGSDVALWDGEDLRAILHVEDIFKRDKSVELLNVYKTEEEKHPGAARVLAQSDWLIGGSVRVFAKAIGDELNLTPNQLRTEFADRGWKTIVAFQTRNPIHRAHEYIQKCALETVDGLLVHPLVGATKSDDVPADVRIRCYKELLENYYPKDRTKLAAFPAAMRYAGPREAIHHALARKNYGCTHFIVGRDHAGVGNYYGTYDAQRLFDRFSASDLGITPLKFDNTFFCKTCASMASAKTCPHSSDEHVSLSGTAVRALLTEGKLPPPEYSRPEVARILIESYAVKVPA